MNSDLPLVCNMDVFTPTQREAHILVTTQLAQEVRSVDEIENGYTFAFLPETVSISKIVEFISNERLCCPFLEFTLRIRPGDAPIFLSLAGPLGTQEFLRAEFSGVIQ